MAGATEQREACPAGDTPPWAIPEGVWEALRRLIENGACLGAASEADALLVARYNRVLLSRPDRSGPLSQGRIRPEVCAYALGDAHDTSLERMAQRDGSMLWAVRREPGVMDLDGNFVYEPQPSDRDAEFLQRHRFASAQEAFEAWVKVWGCHD